MQGQFAFRVIYGQTGIARTMNRSRLTRFAIRACVISNGKCTMNNFAPLFARDSRQRTSRTVTSSTTRFLKRYPYVMAFNVNSVRVNVDKKNFRNGTIFPFLSTDRVYVPLSFHRPFVKKNPYTCTNVLEESLGIAVEPTSLEMAAILQSPREGNARFLSHPVRITIHALLPRYVGTYPLRNALPVHLSFFPFPCLRFVLTDRALRFR